MLNFSKQDLGCQPHKYGIKKAAFYLMFAIELSIANYPIKQGSMINKRLKELK